MEVLRLGLLRDPDPAGRREVSLVALHSSALRVTVVSYGAALGSLEAPDRDGHRTGVHLTLPTLDEYGDPNRNPHVGATCGRWAGRIRGARYQVDGRAVDLEANDGPHHLHGGSTGMSRRIWDVAEARPNDDGGRVVLAVRSPEGDAGHQGAVDATATYELHGHRLRIAYEATVTAPGVVGLCHHGYWNLAGPAEWTRHRSIADHELRVDAARAVPAGPDAIATGPPEPVGRTLPDLRAARPIDEVLGTHPGGIDHTYALDPVDVTAHDDGLAVAAELHHPRSGRTMTVATDQPAIHLYTGNHLGPPFASQAAVCLEAQQFPDAPHRPELGPAVVHPGEHYRSTVELTFGVR